MRHAMGTTAAIVIGLLGALAAAGAPPPHPLDPLSAAEIEAAVSVLRAAGKVDDASRFTELGLLEPSKAAVLGPSAVPRQALAVVLDRETNARHEGVVDLSTSRLVRWTPIAGAQPIVLMEEYDKAGAAVRADPRWQAAMAKRGITDVARVYLDVWAPGEVELPGQKKAKAKDAEPPRLARALSFLQDGQKNPYGPPIEGVVALVDLNQFTVLDVLDTGVVPVASERTDFYDSEVTGARPRLAPLATSTPEGPGFRVDGQAIAWDRWRLRWSVTPREGLVLYQVAWSDVTEDGAGGRPRPVIYRASLSEMLVPYGDPSEAWSWRSAFDEGEYGLGRWLNPLARGTSAPDHALLLDATFADDLGKPYAIPGAVAVFERDGGILWSHYDSAAGVAARAARELVLRAVTSIGNYDYVQQWVLRQDGGIDFELILTGSLLLKGTESRQCAVCAPGTRDGKGEARGDQRNAILVAPGLLAPNHQHFVSVRLDLDVDGAANAVKEVEVRGEKSGRRNPRGNAFLAATRDLPRERAAARDASPSTYRTWEVYRPDAASGLGHPPAYAIVPGTGAKPFLHPKTALRRRGAFAEHTLHVTRYHDGELYAAGSYPSQNRLPGGLAVWPKDDEPLAGEDVVVWYTIGVTHVPRPEEYPIMNATRVGFRLEPVGFFDRNPALDVPAPSSPSSGRQE